MSFVLAWMFVVILLSLWSLAVWVLHAVGVWAVSNAGALGGASAGVDPSSVPEWLAPWLPPELLQAFGGLLAGLEPLVQWLLQAAPALAGGLTVAAWVLWTFGTVLLVVLGAAAHAMIALWRRGDGDVSGRAASMLRAR